jgi:putative transposase
MTIEKQENPRQSRGQSIFEQGDQIRAFGLHEYKVKSQKSGQEYDVIRTELGWRCSCPDYIFRDAKCKHIWAVEFSNRFRLEVEKEIIIKPIEINACPNCSSQKIVKHGILHEETKDLQRYSCKECGKRFVINLGFEKMKASPEVITQSMELYFSGESLRSVQKFLKLQGVKISHVTIYNWIGKYVTLMESYLEKVKPQLSSTWRADELYLKIKGNTKYLFALIDHQTRFWISQQIADNKGISDVQPLFQQGKIYTESMPQEIITDGAPNFRKAIRKTYWRNVSKDLMPAHISHIHIKGDLNNNRMERFNGEIRQREKVMRSLKRADTPILKGMQIYHNFIREHEGLGGLTPASAGGINIEGQNKWKTLIENASKMKEA